MTLNLGQVPITGTSRDPRIARVKTEQGSTAFELGRSFRAYTQKSLGNDETYALEIVTPINVDITSIVMNVTSGEVNYQGIVLPDSATGFDEVRPVFPLNARTDVVGPAYVPQLTVTGGGVIVGGTEIEQALIRTGNNNQRANIVEETQAHRGAAPGTYYILLTAGNQGGDFTIYSTWEEYP